MPLGIIIGLVVLVIAGCIAIRIADYHTIKAHQQEQEKEVKTENNLKEKEVDLEEKEENVCVKENLAESVKQDIKEEKVEEDLTK